MTLEDLVGIPWELNGRSIKGTDCIGILYLYFSRYKKIKDMHPMFWKLFKQRKFHKNNNEYLKKILDSYGYRVSKDNLQIDNILVFNIEEEAHAGILLPFERFLHSTKSVGSCIEHLRYDYLSCLEYGIELYERS